MRTPQLFTFSFNLFEMGMVRKVSLLMILFCVLISLKNQNAETNFGFSSSSASSPPSIFSNKPVRSRSMFLSMKNRKVFEEVGNDPRSLEYDYYRESCPQAEEIVRAMVQYLYRVRSNVAPALLRLVFHDCFVEGCDASVLLDPSDEIDAEKESPPNETLKGFDLIDTIKAALEESCPGIVSCADVLVLAAREGVALAGGPFYPLHTGRRDSTDSFADVATYELPSPHEDLSKTIASFASRGFSERETVSLLGAHSIGVIHCKFFENRLYNFAGTNEPDPSLDTDFLNLMRSRCKNSYSHTPSSSPASAPCFDGSTSSPPKESGMEMDYEGPGSGFGTLYYRSLLEGKGILYADQQLMAGEETESLVRAYASDGALFRRDFALTMMKLSNLRVLTAPMGQVRINCSRVA